METFGNQIMPKLCSNFYCKFCDYETSKKSSFINHTLSAKHAKSINGNVLETFGNQIMPKLCSVNFTCENCNKIYKNRSGLWKHKLKCVKRDDELIISESKNSVSDDKELIKMLLQQNTELIKEQSDIKQLMLEIIKNGTNNNININNTNSHNKAFNLNFFLNETCKNAMNITEFVDSINLQLSDLEKVGEIGYVEGISNIIIKNLNALDETKRPVHCTDKKRETIYIKDQGQWEKEDDNKTKLKRAINKIAHKNIKLITQFREKYPDCKKYESRLSDKYNKMIIEAMGGAGDNTAEKTEKIIKNITKATIISQK
jgi:hypothetical protein